MINLARAEFQPRRSISILTSIDKRIAEAKPAVDKAEGHHGIRDWHFIRHPVKRSFASDVDIKKAGTMPSMCSVSEDKNNFRRKSNESPANYGLDSILVDDVGHKAKAVDSDHIEMLETATTEKGEKSQNQQGQGQEQKENKKRLAEMQFEIDLELRSAHELAHALNQLDDRDIKAMKRILKNPMNAFQGMARKISYLVFPPTLVWDTLFAFRSAASFPQIERAVRAYEHCIVVIETHKIIELLSEENKDKLQLVDELSKNWKRVNPLLKTGWLSD